MFISRHSISIHLIWAVRSIVVADVAVWLDARHLLFFCLWRSHFRHPWLWLPGLHVAESSDTLLDIARAHDLGYGELIAINRGIIRGYPSQAYAAKPLHVEMMLRS